MNPDDDSIESLIRFAGSRDLPSRDATERAREAALQAWERSVQQTRQAWRSRLGLGWALAAGMCVMILGAAWWTQRGIAPPVAVAGVAAVQGHALLDSKPVRSSQEVLSGSSLDTRDSRVALNIGDTLSLRVDRHSLLHFPEPGRVVLLEGAVYVDSGGLHTGTPLRIDTPAGAVRHVGTQFQVRVTEGRTRVQVREGRVVLEGSGEAPIDLGAGDRVDIIAGMPRLSHGLAAHGEAWDWVTSLTPGFDVENRALGEFLGWLARERGWQLRFADSAIQSRAAEIRLHGSMEGLEAMEMLERVSLVTGVPLSVEQGVLVVGSAP